MKNIFTLLSLISLWLNFPLFSQITVNGTLDESNYVLIASKLNNNQGFGSNIDITAIVYYADVSNSVLYLGIKGKLDVSNNNGIGILLNISGTGSPAGRAAGSTLGGGGGYHYIGANDGPNFKAGFEVDYMFAFNPGSGSSSVYFDAAKWNGDTKTMEYQGSCNQTGTSAQNSQATGGVFAQNSITFAFNNSGGSNTGLEMAIPFAQIGANNNMSIQILAFVVSNTAYFSNVTIPGNVSGSNLGFNPDFGTLSGGHLLY